MTEPKGGGLEKKCEVLLAEGFAKLCLTVCYCATTNFAEQLPMEPCMH